MSSFPRILLIGLNVAALIAAAYYIVYANDVSEASSENTCLRESESRIIWICAVISAVAAVGIMGVCLKLKALELFYLFALLITTAVTVVFCMFVSAMIPWHSANDMFNDTSQNGTWLPKYGLVMQKTLNRDWSVAKDCFRSSHTCQIMNNQTWEYKVLYIEIGCCSPPNRCGLEQASTGNWVVPKHGLNSTDDECQMWARVGRDCFECDSCKAGYLAYYHKKWSDNLYSRLECIAFLIATSALAYYIFMHDHYLGDNKDTRHGKLVSTNV